MSPITTHVLDLSLGAPARQLHVTLYALEADGSARELARGITDHDGRVRDLLPPASLHLGAYRLTFETGAYFDLAGRTTFYPRVEITFHVRDTSEHHHVPLLLSPYGYSTYRGS